MSGGFNGGKKKRRGKNYNAIAKPFIAPDEGQYIAKAIKPLGSFKVQLEVFFYDIVKSETGKIVKTTFNKEVVIGNVRGSMRRRQYVNPGDIVLVSKREFNKTNTIVDIIALYKPYHYSSLKYCSLVPKEFVFDKSTGTEDANDNIKFDYGDSDEDDQPAEDAEYKKELKSQKRRDDANTRNYMDNIMPQVDEGASEANEAPREVDELGNFI
jgi:translation initiation factor IF-1